jgi:hypothetical protein
MEAKNGGRTIYAKEKEEAARQTYLKLKEKFV